MLDIKYYILIDAIARHGSLHAASAAIGLTQPAATHRIKEMERRLAVTLFEKRGRRLVLTPAGKRLLDTAREVIPLLIAAEKEAALLARDEMPALRWGVDAHDIVGAILHEAYSRGIHGIDIYRFSTQAKISALLDKQIDLALVNSPMVPKGIKSLLIHEDELKAVVPITHPLASRDSVCAEDIAQEPYLTFSAAREPGFEFDRFFNPQQHSPETIRIIESVHTLLGVIAAGQQGVSILSTWVVKASGLEDKITLVPLDGVRIPIDWHLAYLDNDIVNEHLPQLEKIFIKTLKNN
ncbi:hypothetical protein BFW38_16065 [Terasakiispira papahanaumokuakeensis]|uniref:HTH lysR-type domain-containing protein n=1 Tax=Terasakiispira papahanaumokuakeensis TaxID=197479 RepID=A0A1E2VCV1_9GAMM|nr:LysR family transcriptional regulator [Terasakiispira papahanaumokuakeensis]ODC04817.1 hypothetical protein BFW38_16065 [Terasakiispira papahanaumokuakeensis]